MAAGGSTRFIENKLLKNLHGKCLIEYPVSLIRNYPFDQRIIVVGHQKDLLLQKIDLVGFQVVENSFWETGAASTIHAALKEIKPKIDACFFFVADQPNLKSDLITAMIEKLSNSKDLDVLIPSNEGQNRNPVLFRKLTFTALSSLRGAQSGKDIFSRVRTGTFEWPEKSCFVDIDTQQDFMAVSDKEDNGNQIQYTTAIILAAGASTRFGANKLLEPWVGEESILNVVVKKLQQAGMAQIILVGGRDFDRLKAQFEKRVTVIENPEFAETSMMKSLQIGLSHVAPNAQHVLVHPADMPLVKLESLLEILANQTKEEILIPSYAMRRGHPVSLPMQFIPELLKMDSKVFSLRDFINGHSDSIKYLALDDPGVVTDIDTVKEFRTASAKGQSSDSMSGSDSSSTSESES